MPPELALWITPLTKREWFLLFLAMCGWACAYGQYRLRRDYEVGLNGSK